VLTFTATGVNVAGNFVLVISNTAATARMTVDDVEWTGYSSGGDPYEEWVSGQGEDPAAPEYDPAADADGDGQNNYDEYLADTDPSSSNVVFEVTSAYTNATGTLTLSYPASANRYYQLEYCTNLTGGQTIVSNLGWGGSGTLNTNIPNEWYGTIRVRLTAP
jgi:hypothetical protein